MFYIQGMDENSIVRFFLPYFSKMKYYYSLNEKVYRYEIIIIEYSCTHVFNKISNKSFETRLTCKKKTNIGVNKYE